MLYADATSCPTAAPANITDEGKLHGPLLFDITDINLGAGFSATNLDIVPGMAGLQGFAPSWQSTFVPNLNGADVFFLGSLNLSYVVPNLSGVGVFTLSSIGNCHIICRWNDQNGEHKATSSQA